jgi:hypothetical protein
VVNGLRGEPDLDELATAKDAMLTSRELENCPLQTMGVALTAYIAVNATRTANPVGITLPHCCL